MKQSGLGDGFLVDGFDISGSVGSVDNVGGGPNALDYTTIDQFAKDNVGGLLDGRIEFTSWFDPDPGAGHDVLSALPTADRVLTYQRGRLAGSPAASIVAKQINYDSTRGTDAALSMGTQGQGQGSPLEWGTQITAGSEALTGPADLAGLDNGAASAFGLVAYLHVLELTGTDIIVTLQESTDDAGIDPYVAVAAGGFATATGVGAQRIETATPLAVEQWLRAAVTGTFTSATIMVSVQRREV